jgi:hypothetical protein
MKGPDGRIKNARYTNADPEFKMYLSGILAHLEPIQYERQSIILDELEEVNQVTYIMNAEHHVGFSMNKKMHF